MIDILFKVDREHKLAQAWCTKAERNDPESLRRVGEFIAACKKDKIFVAVYESGDEDLLENTKALIAANLS